MKYNDIKRFLKCAEVSPEIRQEVLDNYKTLSKDNLLKYRLKCSLKSQGIYSITNLNTNKRYIGQSKNIDNRLRAHKYQLRKGAHHNKELQEDWNNLQEDYFKFEVLELCPLELLDQKEIEWHLYFKNTPLYSDVYKFITLPVALLDKVELLIQEYKNNKLN